MPRRAVIAPSISLLRTLRTREIGTNSPKRTFAYLIERTRIYRIPVLVGKGNLHLAGHYLVYEGIILNP